MSDLVDTGVTGELHGAFSHKKLDVTFKLGKGQFGESGFNTVKLTGHRVSASVVKAGEAGLWTMQLRMWGLSFDMMNKLSTFGQRVIISEGIIQGRNEILLEAGDSSSDARSTVFSGTISQAWADFQGMPDVPFHMMCVLGGIEAMKPVPPLSYRGLVDVATVMGAIAAQMGRKLENNGVSVKVVDPYLPGTATEQMRRLADMAHIEAHLDDNNVLAIWPKGAPRGKLIPVVGPGTGMVGYPTYAPNGIVITCLYNPALIPGGRVQIKSSLPRTEGVWIILALTQTLDAEVPGGNWFSRLELYRPGEVVLAVGAPH